jgi:hypothetical protein
MATSASSKGKSKIHKVMKEHKEGKLKSGNGRRSKAASKLSRLHLSEARESGAKIPKKSLKDRGLK